MPKKRLMKQTKHRWSHGRSYLDESRCSHPGHWLLVVQQWRLVLLPVPHEEPPGEPARRPQPLAWQRHFVRRKPSTAQKHCRKRRRVVGVIFRGASDHSSAQPDVWLPVIPTGVTTLWCSGQLSAQSLGIRLKSTVVRGARVCLLASPPACRSYW